MKGVYAILCLTNGRRYVGSSNDVENRWSVHRCELRLNKHYNADLQSDYDTFGVSNMIYSVLEEVIEKDLIVREQYWIDFYAGSLYNKHPRAGTSKGYKLSEEQRKAMSESSKARCTDEWKEAVSDRVKRQHSEGKFGRPTWSEEAKEEFRKNMSEALKGRVLRPNRPISEESRERYRLAAIKREALKKLNKDRI